MLEGYNQITFPHCICDGRKNGSVILLVSLLQLLIRACDSEGNLEVVFLFFFSDFLFLFSFSTIHLIGN